MAMSGGWLGGRLPVRRSALSSDAEPTGVEYLPLPNVPKGKRKSVHDVRRRADVEFVVTSGTSEDLSSSDIAERGFCARCGTPLTYLVFGGVDRVSITLGSLDGPARR